MTEVGLADLPLKGASTALADCLRAKKLRHVNVARCNLGKKRGREVTHVLKVGGGGFVRGGGAAVRGWGCVWVESGKCCLFSGHDLSFFSRALLSQIAGD